MEGFFFAKIRHFLCEGGPLCFFINNVHCWWEWEETNFYNFLHNFSATEFWEKQNKTEITFELQCSDGISFSQLSTKLNNDANKCEEWRVWWGENILNFNSYQANFLAFLLWLSKESFCNNLYQKLQLFDIYNLTWIILRCENICDTPAT